MVRFVFFFFKQKTAYEMRISDWSSDVCSSDLSSTALVLPIAGTKSAVGRSSFPMLLFDDLALVPIIFVLAALSPVASGDSAELILTTLWQGGLVVAALAIGVWFLLPKIFAQAARAKDPELFLAASLLVVIVAALATAAVGLSPIVGALLAGLMIAEPEYHGGRSGEHTAE